MKIDTAITLTYTALIWLLTGVVALQGPDYFATDERTALLMVYGMLGYGLLSHITGMVLRHRGRRELPRQDVRSFTTDLEKGPIYGD